jgi:hypothetical protein
MSTLTTLTPTELQAVAGGIAPPIQPFTPPTEVLAEDIYGDTMSIEDWMAHVGSGGGSTGSIFDFPGGKGR